MPRSPTLSLTGSVSHNEQVCEVSESVLGCWLGIPLEEGTVPKPDAGIPERS
jgi:hypothetical protein